MAHLTDQLAWVFVFASPFNVVDQKLYLLVLLVVVGKHEGGDELRVYLVVDYFSLADELFTAFIELIDHDPRVYLFECARTGQVLATQTQLHVYCVLFVLYCQCDVGCLYYVDIHFFLLFCHFSFTQVYIIWNLLLR